MRFLDGLDIDNVIALHFQNDQFVEHFFLGVLIVIVRNTPTAKDIQYSVRDSHRGLQPRSRQSSLKLDLRGRRERSKGSVHQLELPKDTIANRSSTR